MVKKLRRCKHEGTEHCICGIPPSQLYEEGRYCPYDPEFWNVKDAEVEVNERT